MSVVTSTGQRACHRERGMNMVETMLVLLTLSIMSSMIVNSIRRFTSAHAYSEGQARLHEIGDRVCRQVADDGAFAAHVFTATGDATNYFAKCDLTGLLPWFPTAPVVTDIGYFQKDVSGNATTGNYLFLAKPGDAYVADLVGDRSYLSTAATYRWVLYVPVLNVGRNLDLARWVSQPIARLNDIERITDPVKRTLMGQRLYDDGYRYAWEPGKPVATGLRLITSSGTLASFPPDHRLPAESAELRPALFHVHRMALAKNDALSSVPVPGFAIANQGFPGGFEVKVDGIASGRMILFRLVGMTGNADGSKNAVVFTRTMSNRAGM